MAMVPGTWAGHNRVHRGSPEVALYIHVAGPPGGLGAGRACCLFRAKVLRLGSPVCGRVGSR